MKRVAFVLMLLTMLALCTVHAPAEEPDVPGKAFPGFAVTDVQGGTSVLPETPENREAELQGYVLHIIDQDGAPVQGVMISFCTDTACTMLQSDVSGTVFFSDAPDVYHVRLLKVPAGYSFDTDFELYTEPVYSEGSVCIRKN